MKKTNRDIAVNLKERLSPKVPLIDFRLFGSRARDDFDENSDMDVFIELEEVTQEMRTVIADTAWELGLENLIHISPIVFSRHEIEDTPQRSSPLVRNILREGIRI